MCFRSSEASGELKETAIRVFKARVLNTVSFSSRVVLIRQYKNSLLRSFPHYIGDIEKTLTTQLLKHG